MLRKNNLNKVADFFGVYSLPRIITVYWPFRFFGRVFALISTILCIFIRPKLIWSRDPFSVILLSKIKFDVILEHHTTFSNRTLTKLLKSQNRTSFKFILCISEMHKKYLKNNGFIDTKLIVAHSGVDLEYIESIHTESGKKSRTVIVMYAGSFYKGRGIEHIIELAKRLLSIQFICIGGKLEYKANNVIYMDKISRPQLIKYLKTATILIAPYTKHSESISGENISQFQSPLKIMEYLAIGKPIITTNIGAIPEIVNHNVEGILVNESDIDEMCNVIMKLVNDAGLRKYLSENARKRAHYFSWHNRVATVLSNVAIDG